MHSFGMDFPVSMGGYEFTQNSDEPTVIHGTYVPTAPDQGLKAREQHIAGRRKLYEQSFDELESKIVRQMSGALEGGGFDAERDIAAITVNRWPHGYAYGQDPDTGEIAYMVDEMPRERAPWIAARRPFGRISIANSDAGANAMSETAIGEGHRAVMDLVESR
jgi:spermidine dehydrogenase